MLNYNKKLKQFSRNLRNNMTDAEKLLWSKIRMKQLKVPRRKLWGKIIG
jgi:very-short-patch-repair endonuclease